MSRPALNNTSHRDANTNNLADSTTVTTQYGSMNPVERNNSTIGSTTTNGVVIASTDHHLPPVGAWMQPDMNVAWNYGYIPTTTMTGSSPSTSTSWQGIGDPPLTPAAGLQQVFQSPDENLLRSLYENHPVVVAAAASPLVSTELMMIRQALLRNHLQQMYVTSRIIHPMLIHPSFAVTPMALGSNNAGALVSAGLPLPPPRFGRICPPQQQDASVSRREMPEGGSVARTTLHNRNEDVMSINDNNAAGRGADAIMDTTVVGILPVTLSHPLDSMVLSNHQIYLREQMELFQATALDVATPTRGRVQHLVLGQVGIRCRHCANVPVRHRQMGSTYYPTAMWGLYQAAQNICTTHLQCGKCVSTPDSVKDHFKTLLEEKTKSSSTSGRAYWAKCAQELGLVNTEDGILVSQ